MSKLKKLRKEVAKNNKANVSKKAKKNNKLFIENLGFYASMSSIVRDLKEQDRKVKACQCNKEIPVLGPIVEFQKGTSFKEVCDVLTNSSLKDKVVDLRNFPDADELEEVPADDIVSDPLVGDISDAEILPDDKCTQLPGFDLLGEPGQAQDPEDVKTTVIHEIVMEAKAPKKDKKKKKKK